MSECRQIVHVSSDIIHFNIVIGTAVNGVILGADNFAGFQADCIAGRVKSAEGNCVCTVLREIDLQFAAKALSRESLQLIV